MTEESWQVLDVPDDAVLLRRVFPGHFNHVKRTIQPGAFANRKGENSHSVNWERYASEESTLYGHDGFGVVQLRAKDYRELKQTVDHTPDRANNNYGHCDAVGQKTARIKKALVSKAVLRAVPVKKTT